MKDPMSATVRHIPVWKVNEASSLPLSDIVSVEEPLEIRLGFGEAPARQVKSISVTMRTPGHDAELAAGFLYTEGIISSFGEIKEISGDQQQDNTTKQYRVQVELHDNITPNLRAAERNFYTTSSCGVCGKSSIESIRTVSPFRHRERPSLNLSRNLICQLPDRLLAAQGGFAATGGIHASGLFTMDGELVLLREDVGRHNALDKLIGCVGMQGGLPLHRHIILLSGRVSFELIQKAAMAGASVVAAIGAPSSLAVELARELDITLLGFVKEDRFNIYHSSERMDIHSVHESQR